MMGSAAEDADIAYEMTEWWEDNYIRHPPAAIEIPAAKARTSQEIDQVNRWRCCITGCNPKLFSKDAADNHKNQTGHRIAKWPIRSAEGKRKASQRNRTGYYDKYNVGYKSAGARGIEPGVRRGQNT